MSWWAHVMYRRSSWKGWHGESMLVPVVLQMDCLAGEAGVEEAGVEGACGKLSSRLSVPV